jgi:hypothetical protein
MMKPLDYSTSKAVRLPSPEECPIQSQLPEEWTLTVNYEACMTPEDWEHARQMEASGTFDFWLEEPDLYD